MCVSDQRQAWVMKQDGSYAKRDLNEVGIHEKLMMIAKQSVLPIEEKMQSVAMVESDKATDKN